MKNRSKTGWLPAGLVFLAFLAFPTSACVTIGQPSAELKEANNRYRELSRTVTAIAVFFQAATTFMDAKYPPEASWA